MRRSLLALALALACCAAAAAQPAFSLYADRTRCVEIAPRTEYMRKGPITVEFWLRSDELGSCYPLSFSQDNLAQESGFYFYYREGKLRFMVKTASTGVNEWDASPGAMISQGRWHHVAGVWDGSTVFFYLDGRLMESRPATGDLVWDYKPIALYFGAYIDDNESDWFLGNLAELRIWDRALGAEEIPALMGRQLSGGERGLLGYWRLDGLRDGKVEDLSPLRNHGTIKRKG